MQKGLFEEEPEEDESDEEGGNRKGVRWDKGVVDHSRKTIVGGMNRMNSAVSNGARQSQAGLISMNMNQTKIGFD